MLRKFEPSVARSLHENLAQFPVDFNVAWQWLGYDTLNHAKTSLLSMGFIIGIDLEIDREEPTLDNPCPQQQIKLTVECLKTWALMVGSEGGLIVRKCLLECERTIQPTPARLKPGLTTPRQVADLAMFVSQQAGAIAGLSPELSAQLALQAAILVCPTIAEALKPMQQAISDTDTRNKLLTVSQLSRRIGLGECKTIELLIAKGLERVIGLSPSGKLEHLQTPLGEQYSEFVGSAADGTRELRWKESVIDLLRGGDRN